MPGDGLCTFWGSWHPTFPWLVLSGSFALISLLTDRRKAIVQIVVFLFCFWACGSLWATSRIASSLGPCCYPFGSGTLLPVLDPSDFLQMTDFGEMHFASWYFGDLWHCWSSCPLCWAAWSGYFGRYRSWCGHLAQTGSAGVANIQGEGFSFVSESGVGKIIAELGWPGIDFADAVLGVVKSSFLLSSVDEIRTWFDCHF